MSVAAVPARRDLATDSTLKRQVVREIGRLVSRRFHLRMFRPVAPRGTMKIVFHFPERLSDQLIPRIRTDETHWHLFIPGWVWGLLVYALCRELS